MHLTSLADYRQLIKFYDEQALKYHTYRDRENSNLSVMKRNSPVVLNTESISNKLKEMPYPTINVIRLPNKENFPMPLSAAELTSNDMANETFNLTKKNSPHLCVEPHRKSRDTPKCRNYYRYAHTKNYCKLDSRCVKCSQHHHHSKCPIKKNNNKTI